MTKTTFASKDDHEQAMTRWFVVDASRHVLGRMAVKIAEVLMGKHTPLYTPHVNVGNGVIVINAARVGTTGNKRETRVYHSWTGYPGGVRNTTLGDRIEQQPEALIKDVVRRMLPKTRMGHTMLKRLKVYAGPDHEQVAQKPEELRIED
jgi:large subunit ribosomal protein L13